MSDGDRTTASQCEGIAGEAPAGEAPGFAFSRDGLRAALQDADLPSLMPALAHLTGDLSVLEPGLRATANGNVIGQAPQGGLAPEAQSRARQLALDTLLRWAEGGFRSPVVDDEDRLVRIAEFVTGGPLDVELLPLVYSQLGLESDRPDSAVAERALPEDFSVIVIGAGMSGLAAAYRLKRAGIPFVVLERHHEVGGVWQENTYPGVRLDSSNFCYSYSFAQEAGWQNYYSPGHDVARYLIETSHKVGVRDSIRFNTTVASATFDPVGSRWVVEIIGPDGSRDTLHSKALISAVGQLNTPSIPDIPGREAFQGPSFHTAEWDHSVSLAGKRVAVVGTGASAFQVISTISPEVASMTIFQRTPPWVVPTPTYHRLLPAGLRWLFDVIPYYERWFRFQQFWTNVEGRRRFATVDPEWDEPGSVSPDNKRLRDALVKTLEQAYDGRPDLLAKMTPDYPPYAKRMLRDDGKWAATLRSDHVEVVTHRVVQVTPTGIVTENGREVPVDVIIWGTGFKASDFLGTYAVRGRDGALLSEQWSGDARAYAGVTVPGFPNLFLLYGPNTNLVVNGSIVLFSEAEVDYVMACLELMLEKGLDGMEPTPEALTAYYDRLDAVSRRMAYGVSGVQSWYKSASGRVTQNWPLTTLEFWNQTRGPVVEDYRLW